MIALALILIVLGVAGGFLAIAFYCAGVDALERERRQQARRDEYALAQRRITHNRT